MYQYCFGHGMVLTGLVCFLNAGYDEHGLVSMYQD